MALVVKEKRSDESKDCDEKCNDQRDFCTKRKRLRFRCSSEILVLLVETSVDSHLMRVGVVVVVLSACSRFSSRFSVSVFTTDFTFFFGFSHCPVQISFMNFTVVMFFF